MTTFEPGKTYRTRDGREARVYAVDGGGNWPVHGAIRGRDGVWSAEAWTKDGWCSVWDEVSDCDLLPPTPPAPVDEASRYAAAWRAGAEAMREAAIQHVGRCLERGIIASLPLPAPPAAPAPEPERLSGWVNVYEDGISSVVHETKADADGSATRYLRRIACIDLSQHRKGEGLP